MDPRDEAPRRAAKAEIVERLARRASAARAAERCAMALRATEAAAEGMRPADRVEGWRRVVVAIVGATFALVLAFALRPAASQALAQGPDPQLASIASSPSYTLWARARAVGPSDRPTPRHAATTAAFEPISARPRDTVAPRARETRTPASLGEPDAAKQREIAAGVRVDSVPQVLPSPESLITGVVVDAQGGPVAGALVGAVPEDENAPAEWYEDAIREQSADRRWSTRSAADGSFTLANLDEGSHLVWATKHGLSRATVPDVAAGSRDVRVVFASPTRLAGVVVNTDGTPCTSYRLLVRGTDADGVPLDTESYAGGGALGEFEVSGIAAGSYALLAQTSDGRTAHMDVTLGDAEVHDGLRLVVNSGATLEGRVIDAALGLPIAGARVVVVGQVGSAVTDASGSFRVGPLAVDGEVQLVTDDDTEQHVYDARTINLKGRQGRVWIGGVAMVRVPNPVPVGGTAIGCENVDGQVWVTSVPSMSPGENAGVRVGERLLAIDGIDISALGGPALDLAMRGSAGTSVTLTLVTRTGRVRLYSVMRAALPAE